ncbi:MAG: hypothetical protein ACK4UJ_05055 [Leptonema sp. (in: bacteria)]
MFFRILFFIFYSVPLFSLPPFITLEERAQEAPLILIGTIEIIKQRQLFKEVQYITLYVNSLRILKNTTHTSPPKEFFLYLNIYPETFENKLKFIPEKGIYIIFLEPHIKDNEILVFKLYREEPFALEIWTKEKEKKIIEYLHPK